jgi:hypothetical protein
MSPEDRFADALESGDVAGLAPGERDRLDDLRAVLGSDTAWVAPPVDLGERIVEDIGSRQRDARSGRWIWPAAAVFLAVVGLGVVLDRLSDPAPPESVAVVAMTGTELAPDALGTAALRPASNGWAIALEVTNLPPAAPGTFYQAWVNNGDDTVAVGTFHMRGGEATPIGLWSGVDLHDYRTINVTLQDEGAGTETSGRLVLTGTALPFD